MHEESKDRTIEAYEKTLVAEEQKNRQLKEELSKRTDEVIELTSQKIKQTKIIEQAIISNEMLENLDRTLRTRAFNYKKDGHHEVYENTMSLYNIIFGREM